MFSFYVYLHLVPIAYPLFKIFKCERVAALGNPVVPDVNWMFAGSLQFDGLGRQEESGSLNKSDKFRNPVYLPWSIFTTFLKWGNLLILRDQGFTSYVANSGTIFRTILI